MTKIEQSTGKPGWIIFTYDKKIPSCFWINNNECKKLPCIADERICGDTFFRVEKVGPLDFLVADIWMYNSNCVFACSTFKQRHEWLKKLLKFIPSIDGTVNLIHKSNYTFSAINGYELYSNETIGKQGYFIENDNSKLMKISSLSIPDCYEVGTSYLRVPDLKTSVFLRKKEKQFQARCIQNSDGSWSLAENILDI